MGAADPGGDLIGVIDRGGEANELDVVRTEDDRLFPGGAALGVGQVVNLVEDDRVDVVQIPGRLQEHVAQNLGGHDDDASVPVLRDVAGEQPHLVAVDLTQIPVFLVRQGLDRRGVNDAAGPLNASQTPKSATTVLPVPVGAATMTESPASRIWMASR